MLSDLSIRHDVAPSPPHLLHVFPGFDIGGSQRRLAMLMDLLPHEFRHTIIALNGRWEALSLMPPRGTVATLSVPHVQALLPTRLMRIRAALDFIAPDALLTYNWGTMEWALANRGRRPHLHHEDGFGAEESRRQLQRRVWTRRLALRDSLVMVPSGLLSRIATRRWGIAQDRLYHIPNGIIPSDHVGTALERMGLDIPIGRCRIVWVGALRREKNPARLLRAFAPLADRAVLLMVGEGPERQAIVDEATRLGITAQVHLLGQRDDARSIILQSDILALSSDTEQMPFAVLEAMDAGLPVAAMDVGDIRTMVSEENRPFIVPLKREGGLGAAFAALVGDPRLCSWIGQANRRRARNVYGGRQMAARYRALIDAVLERRRHG